jgi:hypothetical protein
MSSNVVGIVKWQEIRSATLQKFSQTQATAAVGGSKGRPSLEAPGVSGAGAISGSGICISSCPNELVTRRHQLGMIHGSSGLLSYNQSSLRARSWAQ